MESLVMELRDVRESERVVVGVVVPYDEVSYMTPDPRGERIRRGAFTKSVRQRGDRIPLFRNHDHAIRYGLSRRFIEGDDGLIGEFVVNPGERGDVLLEECRDGYLGAMSAGFVVLGRGRGVDGVGEVVEGKLEEASLVGLPAYGGASMLAVRNAQNLDELLAPFRARPDVNLAPIPPLGYRPR